MIRFLIGIALGIAIMFGLDRHPTVGFTLPIPFFHKWIGLPESLRSQRDAAVAAGKTAATDLATCHGNVATAKGLIEAQNTALKAVGADSDRMDRQIAQGAQAAAKAAAASVLRSARILAANDAGETCAAYEAVDAAVVEGRHE